MLVRRGDGAGSPEFADRLRKRGDHLAEEALMSERDYSAPHRFFQPTAVKLLHGCEAGTVKFLGGRDYSRDGGRASGVQPGFRDEGV
jgi:hypothetical protein